MEVQVAVDAPLGLPNQESRQPDSGGCGTQLASLAASHPQLCQMEGNPPTGQRGSRSPTNLWTRMRVLRHAACQSCIQAPMDG